MSTSNSPFRMTLFAASVLVAGLAAPASAQVSSTDPLNPAWRNQYLLQGRNAEVQAIERIQQGRQYQQNQEFQREIDRQVTPDQRGLKVPIVRQKCQKTVFGNNFITTCK